MKEIEFLRSMWGPKIRRKIKLIVPEVTYLNNNGSLNNGNWKFIVPYAFRDALDIKYEPRKKDGVSTREWTQGPILRFKEGDSLHSRNGKTIVQVQNATPMGWDVQKNQMHEGNVGYIEYEVEGSHRTVVRESHCTQMEFLELLIYGA